MKFTYSVVVGKTPKQVVYSNPRRTSLTIYNNSAGAKLFYGADNSVTPENGMVILAQSGWSFLKGLGDVPQAAYWLVADAEGVDVRIAEAEGEVG